MKNDSKKNKDMKFYGMNREVLHESLIINTIMNNSLDTFYFKDINSVFTLSSKAHALFFGIEDPAEVIGKSDFDYFPEYFAKQALKDEKKIIETGIPMKGRQERWIKPNGETIWFSASKYPLYDNDGKIIGTWGTSKDITAMKKAEEDLALANMKLEELSLRDSLSGLYNHRHFYEVIKKLFSLQERNIKKGEEKYFSVIFLDIDSFKNINDTYGHLIGDLAIKHIADIMLRNTRLIDECFRYGGDEFAIILLDTDIEQARKVSEKIRSIIEKTPLYFSGNELSLTVSIGTASSTEEKDINGLIQKTDERLYQSKKEGKNRVN